MPRSRALLATVVLSLTALACSSGDAAGDGAAAAPTTTATTAPPAPGTVTVNVSDVTNASNLIMVAMIGNNIPTQPLGAACAIVDADPFSFEGTFYPIAGPDPCTLGPAAVELAPGTYDVIVPVMPGGARTPDQCGNATVTVDGDTTVELTGLGAPDGCGFGA